VQNDGVSTVSAGVVDGNGTGLTSGEDYVFRVAATTEVLESGERVVGAYSAEVTVTAEGLPAAPTGDVKSECRWNAGRFVGGTQRWRECYYGLRCRNQSQ